VKVVWLCHLNNEYISGRLGVKKSIEYAPWIYRLVEIFEVHNDVEVHVVAPHRDIISEKTFSKSNIIFHFFPFMLPLIPKRIIHFFHHNTDFYFIKRTVKRIINNIKPDIIHLFGTENAYYTSSVFQFRNIYPVFITVQGFITNMATISYLGVKRKKIERELIQQLNLFGIRNNEMKDFIFSINPEARLFYHELSPNIPKLEITETTKKLYDIIFFARISRDKGVEDLIEAASIIVEEKKDLKVVIIGTTSPGYIKFLKRKVSNLGIDENVIFKGHMKNIEDVHRFVIQSRVTVLPTYADAIPGTIIESMFLGVPCVSYSVGGIPTLNEHAEVIKLVNKGNIQGLVKETLSLLKEEELYNDISVRAKKYAEKRWNNDVIYNAIIKAYKEILQLWSTRSE